jgi:hypothetical protein
MPDSRVTGNSSQLPVTYRLTGSWFWFWFHLKQLALFWFKKIGGFSTSTLQITVLAP